MKPRKPQQTTKTLIDKLRSDGPVVLTREELRRLQTSFEDVTQTNLKLDRMVRGMAAAIYRKRLKVTCSTHDDGTVSFDLQPAPPDVTKPITMN